MESFAGRRFGVRRAPWLVCLAAGLTTGCDGERSAVANAQSAAAAEAAASTPSQKLGPGKPRATPGRPPATPAAAQTTASGADDELKCTAAPFASSVAIAEASGATWVEASFELSAHVVIVGDSGTKGAFAVIDSDTGASLGGGALPLDPISGDDLEGFTRSGDRYYAITSGGYVTAFRRTGALSFARVGASYPLHPDVLCASPRKTNCGHDFEGLCLARDPGPSGCDGFAAAKAKGTLLCLEVDDAGRLRADPSRTIEVASAGQLAGCAVSTDGELVFAGMNMFGGNAVIQIHGARTPASARKQPLGLLGPGFSEAIATSDHGRSIYRFSDLARSPSLMAKYSCSAGQAR